MDIVNVRVAFAFSLKLNFALFTNVFGFIGLVSLKLTPLLEDYRRIGVFGRLAALLSDRWVALLVAASVVACRSLTLKIVDPGREAARGHDHAASVGQIWLTVVLDLQVGDLAWVERSGQL